MQRRAWLSPALACAGLLLVPFLVWLILPSPPKITIPEIVAATVAPRPRPTPKLTAPPSLQPAPRPTTETATTETEATSVHGRVLGPDGAGATRASVACTDRAWHTVTDLDGKFELPADAVGCQAVARRPGFGTSAPVTLRAGDDRANTLELRGGGRIEGVVVDEKGAPVTKFQLAVEKFIGGPDDDEGSNGRARTIEDEKGQFTMEKLTPGKYVLSAAAEGRPPARTDTLEVESGRSVTGVRITLARGVLLSGTVTDADTRKPIAGARVGLDSVTSSGVSSVRSVTTDEHGAYSLEGAPPGAPFSIRVEKDGYRSRIVSALEARGAAQITSDVQLKPRGEGTQGEAELGGIGAALGPRSDALGAVILSLVPDGPAALAGLQPQDRIERIDGASTSTMTLPECIQRLRGEPGTRVSVSVKRGDRDLSFDLTRAVVVR